MRTERIPVAPGVELAVDCWEAGAGPEDGPGVVGRNPSFLLVHGLASNARMWDGVAEALSAAGFEALTVDLRGHGRSSKPEDGYDVPTVADDLQALIAGMGLDRPIVAGQSWGGNVVLELAARHPGSSRGIALVDGGWLDLQAAFPDWESCRTVLAPPRLAGTPAADVERYIRSAHSDWPETGIRGALANFEVRPDGTVAPWLTFDRHLLVLRGLWEHRPAERYGSISVPVLLCPADDGDESTGERKRQGVEVAAAAIPAARVEWFRGDHDIHAQHPVELAAALMTLAAPTADGGAG
ncbi:MAG: alpha/beta fold hydrolase [Candidatus Limnocylindrales bacterium]